jgi:hypothetical protein
MEEAFHERRGGRSMPPRQTGRGLAIHVSASHIEESRGWPAFAGDDAGQFKGEP